MKSLVLALSPLALLLASTSALAAPPPPPGIGDVLQQATPPPHPTPQTPLPAIEGIPSEPPMAALPGGETTFTVAAFKIVGAKVIRTAVLDGLVKDAVGKPLTLGQLNDVAVRITRYYRTKGYFVARAYVPAQEVVGGTVVIRVIEGRYGDFHLKNHGRLHDAIAQSILDAVKARDIVSVDTLERAMLIMNDTPGVKVEKVSVSPGTRVGTSDFNVETGATPFLSGVAAVDNYGSVYTGRVRASVSASVDGVTGSGDRLDLFAMASEHNNLDSGRLAYTRLLTPTGLQGEVGVSYTDYSLGGTYASLDSVGHALSVDAQLNYPILLSEARRLQGQIGFVHSDLQDDIRSTDTKTPKHTDVGSAGLEFSETAPTWANQAGGSISVGALGIDDVTARAQDALGARTQGIFAKFTGHIERRQALPDGFVLNAAAHVQFVFGGSSLDGSQKLSVSGSSGVIVYSPDELLGDEGVVGHIAISRPFAVSRDVSLTPSVFYDVGWGRNKFAQHGTPGERTLGDAGIGVIAAWRRVSLTVQWASRVSGGKATSEPTAPSRILAQLGLAF